MDESDRKILVDQQDRMLRYMRKRLDEEVERWRENRARDQEWQEIEGYQVSPIIAKAASRNPHEQ